MLQLGTVGDRMARVHDAQRLQALVQQAKSQQLAALETMKVAKYNAYVNSLAATQPQPQIASKRNNEIEQARLRAEVSERAAIEKANREKSELDKREQARQNALERAKFEREEAERLVEQRKQEEIMAAQKAAQDIEDAKRLVEQRKLAEMAASQKAAIEREEAAKREQVRLAELQQAHKERDIAEKTKQDTQDKQISGKLFHGRKARPDPSTLSTINLADIARIQQRAKSQLETKMIGGKRFNVRRER